MQEEQCAGIIVDAIIFLLTMSGWN